MARPSTTWSHRSFRKACAGRSSARASTSATARVPRPCPTRLELFFQPIVSLRNLGGRGFHELTVRLRDDDGELVPPSQFIPAAERYNVMSVLDRWVVGQAIELLRQRERSGQPLPLLAVNLSGTSLNEQAFVDFVLPGVAD